MKRSAALLLSLSLLSAGCASTPLTRQDDTLAQEVRELRTRIVELQRKAAMNEVELARLRQQVAEMEARQGGARPAPPAASAAPRITPSEDTRIATAQPPRSAPSTTTTTPRSVAPAQPQTQTVRPSTPSTSTTPPQPRRETPPATTAPTRREPVRDDTPTTLVEDIESEDLDVPEPAPQRAQPSPAPRTPPQQAPATPAPSAPSAPSSGAEEAAPAAQALYDRGYTLYHQGHFVDAEASFQRFLQADSASELADNAQYWIGECRYARGDMRGALAAFRETVERYPAGNKVPDALLKAGQALEGMRDVEGARVTYREVVRRFPGTTAATAAEERQAKLPR